MIPKGGNGVQERILSKMCLQGWTMVGEKIGQGNNLARGERGLHGNTAICEGSSHFMF